MSKLLNRLPPIVLIGAARSGTKFLRDVLVASEAIACVPYDVNYIWRFGQSDVPHDQLDPSSLTNQQAQFIRRELTRLSKPTPGQAVLEKTVSNTLRVPFVEAVLPGARYIHLIRDGRDVTESAMRMWQATPDWSALLRKLRSMPLYNIGYVMWFANNFLAGRREGRGGGRIWGPRFIGAGDLAKTASLSEVCATQWAASVEAASTDLAQLPQDRVFEITYEDLIAGPDALRTLCDWLEVRDTAKVLNRHAELLSPNAPEKWKALPLVDRNAIARVAGPILSKLNYPADLV